MKKLIFMLLLPMAMFSQEVFNVQQYCVDKAPFREGQCDIKGNEYSFVFLEAKNKKVVFFFTDTKLKYSIVESNISETDPEMTVYTLQNESGFAEMKINKKQDKITFLFPEMNVYLTVGKSTKL